MFFLPKYAYKAEPYVASEYKTVHEELTKSMTTILKPSADFLTSNKLLKVCVELFFFTVCAYLVVTEEQELLLKYACSNLTECFLFSAVFMVFL